MEILKGFVFDLQRHAAITVTTANLKATGTALYYELGTADTAATVASVSGSGSSTVPTAASKSYLKVAADGTLSVYTTDAQGAEANTPDTVTIGTLNLETSIDATIATGTVEITNFGTAKIAAGKTLSVTGATTPGSELTYKAAADQSATITYGVDADTTELTDGAVVLKNSDAKKIKLGDGVVDMDGGTGEITVSKSAGVTNLDANDVFKIDNVTYTVSADGEQITTKINAADGPIFFLTGDLAKVSVVPVTGTESVDKVNGAAEAVQIAATLGTTPVNAYGFTESKTMYVYQNNGTVFVSGKSSGVTGSKIGEITKNSDGSYKYNGANSNEAITVETTAVGNNPAKPMLTSIIGSKKDDNLSSTFYAATVDGGAGADTITFKGFDGTSIVGGAGKDTIEIQAGDAAATKVVVDGGADNDSIKGTAVFADSNDWTVNGGAGNDVIDLSAQTGAVKNWSIVGGDGNDDIKLNNTITYSTVTAGAGNDTILSQDANTVLNGNGGADIFDISKTGYVANIADYKRSEGDKLLVAAGIVANANGGTYEVSGKLTVGGQDATVTSSDSFYAVTMQENSDAKTLVDVGWTKENAATINNSDGKNVSVIFGDKNSEGDLLIGGTKADTIYAGTNDSIYGGKGSDSIKAQGKTGVYIGLSAEGGADTVDAFIAGWDLETADAVSLMGGTAADLKAVYDGSNVSLKSGTATMTFTGTTGSVDGDSEKILISGKKVQVITKGSTVKVGDDDTIADYYIGTENSAVSIEDYTGNVKVDLGTEMFRNITTVTAGAGNTSVLGSKANEYLAGGKGASSLYGGAGKDTLVSGAGQTTFFANESSGKDVVSGFVTGTEDNSDVINVNALQSITRADSSNFTVRLDNDNSLAVATASGNEDSNIQWASGDAKGVAKIGVTASDNTFSYDRATTNYIGGQKKDVVSVASGSTDNFTVWLDQTGGMFSSVEGYDFSQTTGDVLAAGKADTQETIVGGKGNTSLWGGAGSGSDVLQSTNGSTTQFFYGLGDGNDAILGQNSDSVNLYNLNLSDITKATITDGNNVVFTTTANETVTVSGGVGTFKLADGTSWTADYSNKSWTQN